MINFLELAAGQKLNLKDGSVVEVTENIGDGIWVNAKWISSPDGSKVGEEELVHCEEATSLAA